MKTIERNITRMIGSYPTSFNQLNKCEIMIQQAVSARFQKQLTTAEQERLVDMLENHDNDYFVKAFRKQFSIESATEVTAEEAVQFALRVCKSVAS